MVIAFDFLQSMTRRVTLQITQLMNGAALHRFSGPVLFHRDSQPLVPVNDYYARRLEPAADKTLEKSFPARTGLALKKFQV